ncbi:MAG: 23S rRNA (uracil(1939)-C(5))-methyltransferase RlmD, partial [Coriobacteriaceae bacterium]|nr:23S rRNA (uracil(1939)-C(5))-methyltransferase RlmD [Coriobacteriaceae bacterium]
PLAEASYDTVAVESAGSSVRDLRYNLEHNGLDAEVIGGDVGRELPELGYADVAVVDPPRSGLAPEALKALLDTRARRIAYVSCDPTTLARDLKAVLADGRYRIYSVQPVDLFPQTFHVETVCILDRN